MKLRSVDIGETVRRFLYGARFGGVAQKAFSVLRLFFAESGMRAATYTNPTTAVSVPASAITARPLGMSGKNARAFL
jgi:hypothetical protein